MATEVVQTGKKYRILVDAANKIWHVISFWTKGSDVEFNDGDDAETKVGAIKGITTSTSVTTAGYAADATTVTALSENLTRYREWTLLGNVMGNTKVDIPSGINEIYAISKPRTNNNIYITTLIPMIVAPNNQDRRFPNLWDAQTNSGVVRSYVWYETYQNQIWCSDSAFQESNILSSTETWFYGR